MRRTVAPNALESAPLGRVERDELFRLLVEHVTDYAIYMLDPEGRVMSWNDGAERIKGYRAEEIIGEHFSVFYMPEDVQRGRPAEVLRAARLDGRYAEEGWRRRKDGSRFWGSIVLTALRTEDGDLIGFAKITRDLTERRRVEEERMELLEKERAARAAAEAALANVRAARRETELAEEAVRVRDEFLSIAAHELKTPLTAAKAATQLVQRRSARAGGALDPSLASALGIVERQIDKLALLVTHLLETVRIQADRLLLEPGAVDVAALARENAGAISAATGRDIIVTAPEKLQADVDRLRLDQVLTNLLDNAVKHSPADSPIELTVSGANGTEVEIAVRDRGVGVPPAGRARLFERYFQAHADRAGMGLGLHISRAIVEKHGGTIAAEFPADGGSRFVVRIPRERGQGTISV